MSAEAEKCPTCRGIAKFTPCAYLCPDSWHSTPPAPPPEPIDERAEFEKWYDIEHTADTVRNVAWQAWQARASLGREEKA